MERSTNLVREIQQREGNTQCFRTTHWCDQYRCTWHPYCVGELKDYDNRYAMLETYLLGGGMLVNISEPEDEFYREEKQEYFSGQ